jgi:hypothetical protein
MAGRRPWYEVLEVPPTVSAEEAREAYLALVKAWHPDRFATMPDRFAEAEERLKAVNAAYDEARSLAWAAPRDAAWDEADLWPEWVEGVEPSRYRLMFAPGGLAARTVALLLALLMAFFAVVHTLNALDLATR